MTLYPRQLSTLQIPLNANKVRNSVRSVMPPSSDIESFVIQITYLRKKAQHISFPTEHNIRFTLNVRYLLTTQSIFAGTVSSQNTDDCVSKYSLTVEANTQCILRC